MYNSIIFDFDDTLAEGHTCFSATTTLAAGRLGLRIPTEAEMKYFGGSWDEFINRNWPSLEWPEFEPAEFKREYLKAAKEVGCSSLPGVIEALDELRSGREMYILSKKAKEMMGLRLGQTGINPEWFKGIYCNEDTRYKKPDPRTYDELFQEMERRGNFNLNQILAVGDHPDDYHAAHGAGIKFVGVLTGIYSREDFSQQGSSPEEVIESVASLPEYLKRIGK